MKKFIIQAILLIFIIGIGIVFLNPGSSGRDFSVPFLPEQITFNELQINDAKLKVEVANTPSKRSKGLGGRRSLAQDEGMLFVFSKTDKYPFWMKGLSFPLDFVWIKGLEVVDILPNVQLPQPNQKDESLPIYLPKEEINKVLEVNAGLIQKLNIKIGDTIKLREL